MPQLSSVSQYKAGESLGCSVFGACFGSVFLGLGLLSVRPYFFPSVSCCGTEGTSPLGSLLFISFGLMLVLGNLAQARRALRFREPQVWITEDVVRPGDTFHFFFQQKCQHSTRVESIGVFFVFRERAEFSEGGETSTRDFDRLIQQYPAQEGQLYSPSDTILIEHTFEIPSRFMHLRNPYMMQKDLTVKKMWVVKVRLNLGNSTDIWHEYEVKVQGEPLSSNLPPSPPGRYDVFLVESSLKEFFKHPLRTASVMQKLLPHLRADQLPALSSALLLESVSEAEAQTAKAQLAGVGAQVEIKPVS